MSSISFDATLNTDKLESSIKQSNKTVKEWSEGIEKSGGQVDKAFDKMGVSLKDSIKFQKEYIKGLTSEIKDMQKAFDKATAGIGKSEMGAEIGQAKRRLSEAQERLMGMQESQIALNAKEEQSQNGIIEKLKKWALGIATVGAALKIAKGIIDSTAGTQLKFKEITAEATAGVSYFFKSIASGDWTNFFQGMGEAIRGAREFVRAMDEIENKRNELNIKTSEIDIQIGEARARSYTTDIGVQKAALAEIISLQEEKFKRIAELSENEYAVNLKNAAKQSGLEEQKIEFFLKEFSSLEKLIEMGETYNNLIISRKRWEGIAEPEVILELDKQIEQLGKAGEEAGKYVQQVSKVTPEARKILSDFLAQQNKDIASFNLNNRRDKERLVNLEKQEAKDKIEAAKIENKIKEQEELLNKAIIAGNEKEKKSISEKIVLLKEELILREKLTQQAISAEIDRVSVGRAVIPGAPTLTSAIATSSALAGAPDALREQEKYIKGTTMLTKAALAEVQKAKEKYKKDNEKALEEELLLREQITDAALSLVFQLGEALGLSEEQQAALNNSLNTFRALVSKDIVGAAFGLISGLIAAIPNEAAKFAEQIEHINELMEKHQRLIDQAERSGGEEAARRAELAQLEYERDRLLTALVEAEYKLRHANFLNFQSRFQAVYDLKEVLAETEYAISQAQTALQDFLTGGVTEITIADTIAQGFQDAKTSVDDFASYMNDVLIDAVLDIFKAEILGPAMTEATKFIKDALSDKILTPDEVNDINNMVAAIAESNKDVWDNLTSGLNIGETPRTGLTGQIRRDITEETGQELSGLFRRFADEQRVVKDYSILGVNNLVLIEKNTAETVTQLQLAVVELQAINTNTKQVSVAGL